MITDPRRVNKALSSQDAIGQLQAYLADPMMGKIYHGPTTTEKVVELLRKYKIDRQEVFDVVIVATMLTNRRLRLSEVF